MRHKFTFVLKSDNRKTGPIPVSMTDETSCPESCPLRGKGCYGASGPLNWTWKKSKLTVGEFLRQVSQLPAGTLWRHNQVGDLPGKGDDIDREALANLVKANAGKRGFTYTHKPPVGENRKAIRAANRAGFTVNLSADTLAEADKFAKLAIAPVVVLLPKEQITPTTTPQGRRVIVCPAVTKGIQCKDCKLCAVASRSIIVGFPAHGAQSKVATKIAGEL